MSSIRTVIVDDEEEAREGLRSLLDNQDDVEVVALLENGLEAIEKIQKHEPDLVFLDIQMPEINGFEVLSSLPSHSLPAVIFVTAYDEYALKAFEVHALDYLLKPFTDERFYKALDHAREELDKSTDQSLNHQLKQLLKSYKKDISEKPNALIHEADSIDNAINNERLIIKADGKIKFLSLDNLRWIEAQDYYVKLYYEEETYLVRETMKAMDEQLPGEQFLRIHNSNIINTSYVDEMEPYFSGGYIVKLTTGEELKMSRGYAKKLSFLK